jgi:hypothetical protein
MNEYTIPFNHERAMSISPELTELLETLFPTIRIFDRTSFGKYKHYMADIASCFMVTDGGSYDYLDNTTGKVVETCNGTLLSIEGVTFNELHSFMTTYEKESFP